jgi:hypothetical protein
MMQNSQINPFLIRLLSDQETSIMADSPTTNLLPGKYAKMILKNKKSLSPIIEEKNQR